MRVIIREFVNVLPFNDTDIVAKDEINAKYTVITAKTQDGEDVELVLPRQGVDACKNTYLLADAIRE